MKKTNIQNGIEMIKAWYKNHTIVFISTLFVVLTILFNITDWNIYQSVFRYGQPVGALIAAFLVVNELKRDADAKERESRIQQSTFIKDFNQAFITNPDMMFVESALEEYYGEFRAFADDKKSAPTEDDLKLHGDQLKKVFGEPGTASRQRLINYLVYLEGLTTVLSNGAMEIENVDSLLGYRFFVAVNNPVVQKLELTPFENEYRGIHRWGQEWVNHRYREFKKLSDEKLKETVKYGDYLIPMQKEGFSFKKAELEKEKK